MYPSNNASSGGTPNQRMGSRGGTPYNMRSPLNAMQGNMMQTHGGTPVGMMQARAPMGAAQAGSQYSMMAAPYTGMNQMYYGQQMQMGMQGGGRQNYPIVHNMNYMPPYIVGTNYPAHMMPNQYMNQVSGYNQANRTTPPTTTVAPAPSTGSMKLRTVISDPKPKEKSRRPSESHSNRHNAHTGALDTRRHSNESTSVSSHQMSNNQELQDMQLSRHKTGKDLYTVKASSASPMITPMGLKVISLMDNPYFSTVLPTNSLTLFPEEEVNIVNHSILKSEMATMRQSSVTSSKTAHSLTQWGSVTSSATKPSYSLTPMSSITSTVTKSSHSSMPKFASLTSTKTTNSLTLTAPGLASVSRAIPYTPTIKKSQPVDCNKNVAALNSKSTYLNAHKSSVSNFNVSVPLSASAHKLSASVSHVPRPVKVNPANYKKVIVIKPVECTSPGPSLPTWPLSLEPYAGFNDLHGGGGLNDLYGMNLNAGGNFSASKGYTSLSVSHESSHESLACADVLSSSELRHASKNLTASQKSPNITSNASRAVTAENSSSKYKASGSSCCRGSISDNLSLAADISPVFFEAGFEPMHQSTLYPMIVPVILSTTGAIAEASQSEDHVSSSPTQIDGVLNTEKSAYSFTTATALPKTVDSSVARSLDKVIKTPNAAKQKTADSIPSVSLKQNATVTHESLEATASTTVGYHMPMSDSTAHHLICTTGTTSASNDSRIMIANEQSLVTNPDNTLPLAQSSEASDALKRVTLGSVLAKAAELDRQSAQSVSQGDIPNLNVSGATVATCVTSKIVASESQQGVSLHSCDVKSPTVSASKAKRLDSVLKMLHIASKKDEALDVLGNNVSNAEDISDRLCGASSQDGNVDFANTQDISMQDNASQMHSSNALITEQETDLSHSITGNNLSQQQNAHKISIQAAESSTDKEYNVSVLVCETVQEPELQMSCCASPMLSLQNIATSLQMPDELISFAQEIDDSTIPGVQNVDLQTQSDSVPSQECDVSVVTSVAEITTPQAQQSTEMAQDTESLQDPDETESTFLPNQESLDQLYKRRKKRKWKRWYAPPKKWHRKSVTVPGLETKLTSNPQMPSFTQKNEIAPNTGENEIEKHPVQILKASIYEHVSTAKYSEQNIAATTSELPEIAKSYEQTVIAPSAAETSVTPNAKQSLNASDCKTTTTENIEQSITATCSEQTLTQTTSKQNLSATIAKQFEIKIQAPPIVKRRRGRPRKEESLAALQQQFAQAQNSTFNTSRTRRHPKFYVPYIDSPFTRRYSSFNVMPKRYAKCYSVSGSTTFPGNTISERIFNSLSGSTANAGNISEIDLSGIHDNIPGSTDYTLPGSTGGVSNTAMQFPLTMSVLSRDPTVPVLASHTAPPVSEPLHSLTEGWELSPSRITQNILRKLKRLNEMNPNIIEELQKTYVFLDEENRYSCIKCHYLSPRLDKTLEHAMAHRGKMICHFCNKAFIKMCDIERHMVAHKFNRIRPHTTKFNEIQKGEPEDDYIYHLLPLSAVTPIRDPDCDNVIADIVTRIVGQRVPDSYDQIENTDQDQNNNTNTEEGRNYESDQENVERENDESSEATLESFSESIECQNDEDQNDEENERDFQNEDEKYQIKAEGGINNRQCQTECDQFDDSDYDVLCCSPINYSDDSQLDKIQDEIDDSNNDIGDCLEDFSQYLDRIGQNDAEVALNHEGSDHIKTGKSTNIAGDTEIGIHDVVLPNNDDTESSKGHGSRVKGHKGRSGEAAQSRMRGKLENGNICSYRDLENVMVEESNPEVLNIAPAGVQPTPQAKDSWLTRYLSIMPNGNMHGNASTQQARNTNLVISTVTGNYLDHQIQGSNVRRLSEALLSPSETSQAEPLVIAPDNNIPDHSGMIVNIKQEPTDNYHSSSQRMTLQIYSQATESLQPASQMQSTQETEQHTMDHIPVQNSATTGGQNVLPSASQLLSNLNNIVNNIGQVGQLPPPPPLMPIVSAAPTPVIALSNTGSVIITHNSTAISLPNAAVPTVSVTASSNRNKPVTNITTQYRKIAPNILKPAQATNHMIANNKADETVAQDAMQVAMQNCRTAVPSDCPDSVTAPGEAANLNSLTDEITLNMQTTTVQSNMPNLPFVAESNATTANETLTTATLSKAVTVTASEETTPNSACAERLSCNSQTSQTVTNRSLSTESEPMTERCYRDNPILIEILSDSSNGAHNEKGPHTETGNAAKNITERRLSSTSVHSVTSIHSSTSTKSGNSNISDLTDTCIDEILPDIHKSSHRRRSSASNAGQGIFSCLLCSYTTSDPLCLDKHYDAHNNKKKVCRFCNKAFGKSTERRKHEKKQHVQNGEKLPAGAKDSPVTKQKDDHNTVDSNPESTEKVVSNTENTDIPIEFVTTNGVPERTLTENEQLTHASPTGTQSGIAESNQTYDCTDCPGKFITAVALETHVRKYHKAFPIRLDDYTQSVITSTNLLSCEVGENNEIVISLEPLELIDIPNNDYVRYCPPVSSMKDMSAILETVGHTAEPVKIQISEKWPIVTTPALKRGHKRKSTVDGKPVKVRRKSSLSVTDSESMVLTRRDVESVKNVQHTNVTDTVDVSGKPKPMEVKEVSAIKDSIDEHNTSFKSSADESSPVKPTHRCKTCTFTTSSGLKMKVHQKAHEMNLHLCRICYKAFLKKADCTRHVNATHDAKAIEAAYSTEKIEKSTPTEKAPMQMFKCTQCTYETNQEIRFKLHQKAHDCKQYSCKSCNRVFVCHQNLLYHWFAHNKKQADGLFHCDKCNHKDNKTNIMAHIKTHYPGKFMNVSLGAVAKIKKKKPTSMPDATINEDSSESQDKLSKKKGKKSTMFVCPECQVTFTLPSLLAWHRKKVHNVVTLSTYRCDSCHLSYSSQMKLRQHMSEVHKTEKPLPNTCETCNKSFTSEWLFQKHQQLHSGEKLLQCRGCSKGFQVHQQLSIHQKSCLRYRLSRAVPLNLHKVSPNNGSPSKKASPVQSPNKSTESPAKTNTTQSQTDRKTATKSANHIKNLNIETANPN